MKIQRLKNVKRPFSSTLVVLALTLLGAGDGWGASTRVSTASGGNWNSSATWVGGSVPGKFDTAVIVPGATVTVTADQTVTAVLFSNSSPSVATLSVDPGISLSVSAGITNQNSATTNTSAVIQGG